MESMSIRDFCLIQTDPQNISPYAFAAILEDSEEQRLIIPIHISPGCSHNKARNAVRMSFRQYGVSAHFPKIMLNMIADSLFESHNCDSNFVDSNNGDLFDSFKSLFWKNAMKLAFNLTSAPEKVKYEEIASILEELQIRRILDL